MTGVSSCSMGGRDERPQLRLLAAELPAEVPDAAAAEAAPWLVRKGRPGPGPIVFIAISLRSRGHGTARIIVSRDGRAVNLLHVVLRPARGRRDLGRLGLGLVVVGRRTLAPRLRQHLRLGRTMTSRFEAIGHPKATDAAGNGVGRGFLSRIRRRQLLRHLERRFRFCRSLFSSIFASCLFSAISRHKMCSIYFLV